MTPKEMCDTCTHKGYCMAAYAKDHWCGNHISREQRAMRAKIEPRKVTDRGGYYCMPLRVNVPTGHKDWKLMKCPECGAECWELPLAEVAKAQGARGLCTMCALKKGVNRG